MTYQAIAERCNVAQAALITGLTKRTLQDKASAGLIPGARKMFGRWTFDIAALKRLGSKPCQRAYIKGAASGGRVSRSKASNIEKAYELVLARSRSAG